MEADVIAIPPNEYEEIRSFIHDAIWNHYPDSSFDEILQIADRCKIMGFPDLGEEMVSEFKKEEAEHREYQRERRQMETPTVSGLMGALRNVTEDYYPGLTKL